MPKKDDFLPEIYTHNLPNQMKVVGMEYTRTPWVSITYMAKRGAEADPPGKGGAADCLAECLTLGTKHKDQLELALTTEGRGSMLKAHGSWDHTLITLEGLAEDFSELMALLAEIVLEPGFPEQEFTFLQERRQAELIHYLDDPREVASRNYLPLFFGASPYGHPVDGSPASLAALELADLKSFYQAQCHPRESTLVVVGMVPEAKVSGNCSGILGGLVSSRPTCAAFSASPGNLVSTRYLPAGPPESDPKRDPLRTFGAAPARSGLFPLTSHELCFWRRRLFLPAHDAHPGRKRLDLRHPESVPPAPGPGAVYHFHLHPGRTHRRGRPGN